MLEAEAVLALFQGELPRPARYLVGYSGGLDSTVLLHLLASLKHRLPAPLSAVHVDHALQAESTAWARHCRDQCAGLGVPFSAVRVDARAKPGESPEAAARQARYAAIERLAGKDAMLLTAHHRDDQAETLLLQLLRGSGVEGLAAMPLVRPLGQGWHARPLLGVRREAIRAWAEARGLRWIEDPSNQQSKADRNFLRHQVIPQIELRWPGAVDSMARSAAHCADAAAAVRGLAEQDLDDLSVAGRLRLSGLRALPAPRAREVLRHWLRVQQAPPLSARRLAEALRQLCDARADAQVRVAWAGTEIRRFADQAWLLRPTQDKGDTAALDWTGDELRLAPGLGRVRRYKAPGGISPQAWSAGRVRVAYRSSGFRCRPAGRRGSRSFKKLAQEFGIPPWQRKIIPVVLIDDRPAAVANCCVCEPFAVGRDQLGWSVEWIPD